MKNVGWTLAIAVSLAVAGSVTGQVQQVVGGNALDANPQVGVGGANVKVQAGYVPVNGNDIITGNVSGLKYFHGNVPYSNPNEFQGNLGSSNLNNFARQSSGVPLTQTNQGHTQTYYTPSQIVSKQGFMSSPINGGYDNRFAPGNSISPLAPGARPLLNMNTVLPINAVAPARRYDDLGNPVDASPLQPSGLFGFRNAALNSIQEQPVDALEKQRLEEEKENQRTDIGASARVGATTQAVAGLQRPIQGAVDANPLDQRSVRRNEPDNTVYAMMEKQLKAKMGTETNGADTMPYDDGGTTTAPGSSGATDLLRGAGSNGSSAVRAKPLADESDAKLTAGKKIAPITTFKGNGKSLFDQYMEIAERQLKEGRYLDAAGTYQNVMEIAGDNPLALIGRAHAQLGAGLYLAAAEDLKLVFEKRPDLIAVHYDLRKFLPPTRVDFLLHDVSQLARGKKANPTANFALAYLDYQLGGREEDLKLTLEMWQRQARKDDQWPAVLKRAWLDEPKK